ncbi:MAG: MFS transporter [Reyranellaceae bacterium]
MSFAASWAANPHRKKITLLALCQALALSCTSMSIVATPIAAYSIADTKWLSTLPIALQHLGVMLSTFPASFLMRRIGRQRGFMVGACVGMAGAALATVAMFQASFALLCVGMFFVGSFLGHAQYYRFAAAEVAPDSYRAKAISWVLAGGVLAAVIGPNLANVSRDWLAPVLFAGTYLAMIGLLVVSVAVLVFLQVPKPSEEDMAGPQRPLLEIMSQPVFVVAAGGAVLSYAVMSLLMTATPFAMAACNYPFADTAFVISAHVLGMFVPSFFCGWLITRFGVLNVMLAGVVVLFASVAVNLHGITVQHFWIGLTLLGVGWNFLFTGGTTLVTSAYTSAERAKTQAFNDFLVFGTTGLASLSAGILHELVGWDRLNVISIPLVALALLAVLSLRLRARTAVA